MAYIVVACIVVACILMVHTVMAYEGGESESDLDRLDRSAQVGIFIDMCVDVCVAMCADM